jgi:ABC-2 type transport system permease protein
MRSATSFFDKTLFRSQLKHTWPLWLGYTALWLFLVPVALFSELSAYQGSYSAADASSLLLNAGVRGGVFISFVFGLFFAMLSFSHLTQSRATNGFHALPMRRETIFLTAYLTGLFCQVSTILVTFLLGAAVSAPLHLSFWSVTGAAMGSAMLEAVFFYSFAVLCMMMTGRSSPRPSSISSAIFSFREWNICCATLRATSSTATVGTPTLRSTSSPRPSICTSGWTSPRSRPARATRTM